MYSQIREKISPWKSQCMDASPRVSAWQPAFAALGESVFPQRRSAQGLTGSAKMNQPDPGSPRKAEKAGELCIICVSCLVAVGYLENSPERSLYQMSCRPHVPLVPREIMLWLIIGLSWNTSLGINTQQKGRCPPGRCTVCSWGWQPNRSLLPHPSSSAWLHREALLGWDTEGAVSAKAMCPPD